MPAIADMSGIPLVTTPVLIIGSSMVGMTLSALLPKHGIHSCITVERHASTAIHPRAALFHPRTMQIYRELGLYEAMRAEASKHYDEHAGLYDVESLAGKSLQTYMSDINEGLEHISPTSRLFLTQQMFEPLLRKHAVDNGADLRFSTELVDFHQDEHGVTALLQSIETGAKQLVRAKFMVACDGNRSFVRGKLGIPMLGHGLLSHSLTIYFKADLGKFVIGKYNGVIYVNNEHVRGFFRLDKTGREGFLVVNTAGERGTDESRYPADNITNEKAAEMLRAAIGADVEFEITHLSPWRAVCDVAQNMNDGRILLAGDAAHTVTPNGGFGGNTGIQDAHNIAWKLAAVLQGKAGEELVMKTYHDERWPIGRKTVDQVFERYIVRTAPEFRTPGMDVEEEVPEPHLELGYRYHSTAITTKELGNVTSDPGTAKARAGSMAHHVLILTTDQDSDNLRPFPIADLLGHGFVLIAGHEGLGWLRAARNITFEEGGRKVGGLPNLDHHQLTKDNPAFYDKYDITPAGAVLIRPDGFVAWSERGAAIHGHGGIGMPAPEEVLKCVFKEILCVAPPPYKPSASPLPEKSSAHAAVSTPSSEPKPRSGDGSLAAEIFHKQSVLEAERKLLLDKVASIEARLADLKKLGKLQDEMAMLAIRVDESESRQSL